MIMSSLISCCTNHIQPLHHKYPSHASKKWYDGTCCKLNANAFKGLHSAQDKNPKQLVSISYDPPQLLWCSLKLGFNFIWPICQFLQHGHLYRHYYYKDRSNVITFQSLWSHFQIITFQSPHMTPHGFRWWIHQWPWLTIYQDVSYLECHWSYQIWHLWWSGPKLFASWTFNHLG